MAKNKKVRQGTKHKRMNEVQEQSRVYSNRLKKFDEKMQNEHSWVKRLQLLKDNLTGSEYDELIHQLKIILNQFITEYDLNIDDYVQILHDPTGKKLFELLETDLPFINYLKVQLNAE